MSRKVVEIVEHGPYGDGWTDITCAMARFQEQYRLIDGRHEFRHRPIFKMFNEFSTPTLVTGHLTVLNDEPWTAGCSLDGSGRHWVPADEVAAA